MVEKVFISPNRVRAYGNIVNMKTGDDFTLVNSELTVTTDMVDGAEMTVFSMEVEPHISLTATNPYLVSGETTDLVVSLVNVFGSPLSGKTVTVTGSDGSSYSGITNSNGTYTKTGVSVTGNATFTASYNGATSSCDVYYPCLFVDYGTTSKHNDNIWYTTNATITREATYTNIKSTANWGTAYLGNPSTKTPANLLENNDEIIIELQAHNTFVKGTKGFNVRWNDGTNHFISFPSGIGHHKMVLSKTRVDMYLDDVWKEGYDLNNISNAYLKSVAKDSNVDVQFSDLRIYNL